MLFNRTGVRYEVALDVLGAHLAHHAEAIGVEQDRSQPDGELIRRLRQTACDVRSLRDDLDPNDEAGIERVIQEYGPSARALYGL